MFIRTTFIQHQTRGPSQDNKERKKKNIKGSLICRQYESPHRKFQVIQCNARTKLLERISELSKTIGHKVKLQNSISFL